MVGKDVRPCLTSESVYPVSESSVFSSLHPKQYLPMGSSCFWFKDSQTYILFLLCRNVLCPSNYTAGGLPLCYPSTLKYCVQAKLILNLKPHPSIHWAFYLLNIHIITRKKKNYDQTLYPPPFNQTIT